jgi:ABC-type sugar transport system permease subunit
MWPAFSAMISGSIVALVVNSEDCGVWGMDCFSYAFMILAATMAVSSTLFFRSIENATPGTTQRWMASLLGGICFALSVAGLVAIMMAIAH